MTNSDPVVAALESALADTYAVALKTQNYHWNVRGPQFFSLHGMFEEQYTALHESVDELAERIRALGHLSPGGFAAFQDLTSISDGDGSASANTMVGDLAKDHETVGDALAKSILVAQEAGDEVTVDLFIEKKTFHDKTAWMLRATLAS